MRNAEKLRIKNLSAALELFGHGLKPALNLCFLHKSKFELFDVFRAELDEHLFACGHLGGGYSLELFFGSVGGIGQRVVKLFFETFLDRP